MSLSKTRLAASLSVLAVASIGVVHAVQTRPARPPSGAAGVTSPRNPWPGEVHKTPAKAPVLSAEEEAKTFVLPPGYHAQLVAKEPLVMDPIAIDFDADGRLWVLEMPGFMSEANAMNSREPINDVVVLEDQDGDGVMDKRTVFADQLVLPRSLKVTDHGVLVGEPPNLWLMKDTDGDLKADTKELVSNTYGRGEASIEHNANSLFWGLDNTIYTSEHDWHVRLKDDKFETVPALSRGQWGASQDDAGRIYRNVNDAPLFVDLIAGRYFMRNPNLARTRGFVRPADLARSVDNLAGARLSRGEPRLSRSVLPPGRQLRHDPGHRHSGDLPGRPAAERAVWRCVHHRLDDEPGASLQDCRRRHRPTECGGRLQEGGRSSPPPTNASVR